jgi:hypothetical protein
MLWAVLSLSISISRPDVSLLSEFDIDAMQHEASNQAIELTETRRTTSFYMASTRLAAAERAPGLGSSSCSR